MDYTEGTLVQQTTADYLEQQLGWQSVYAYNNETFGPDSLLGRASDREVVLSRTLREKLVALNPGLPADAYDGAVRQIVTTVAVQTLPAINREKYALLKLVQELDEEQSRAVREGLDEESLAIFDLLRKSGLGSKEIKKVKSVAVALLARLKTEKLRIDHWRDKEATRDAVRVTIRDHLWSDVTGLPGDAYTDEDVNKKAEEVFRHVYRAYPELPSPFYASTAV